MSACVMGTQPSAARNRNYYFPRGTLTANNDTSLHVSFTGCTELKDKSSTAANAFRVSCFPRWGFMFSLLNTVCNATRFRWVDCFWLLEPLCPNRCSLYSGFMFSPCGVSCFPYMLGHGGTGLAVFLVEQAAQARRHKTRFRSSSANSLLTMQPA